MFGKKNLQIEKDRAWSKHGFYLCIPFDKFNTTYVYLYDYVCICEYMIMILHGYVCFKMIVYIYGC